MTALAHQLRWHLKKIARHGCIAGSTLLPRARSGVRVLTYHRIAASARDPFAVAPKDFARQMQWISEQGLAVGVDDLLEYHAGHRELRDGSVLVTIDDGFLSLYQHALPILSSYNVPAIAFVPAGTVEQTYGGDPEPRITWGQLRELASSGIEIGSHGWSHRSFGVMAPAEMRSEAMRSRELLEQRSGREVRTFAYPFGTRADFDATSTRILIECGYRCAFTSQHGFVHPQAQPHLLPRVKIEGGEGIWAFARSCAGGLDAWRFVDRCLWAVQARQG